MTRKKYVNKGEFKGPNNVLVFDEDEKKVYFHHGKLDLPDYLDKKTFYQHYYFYK